MPCSCFLKVKELDMAISHVVSSRARRRCPAEKGGPLFLDIGRRMIAAKGVAARCKSSVWLGSDAVPSGAAGLGT